MTTITLVVTSSRAGPGDSSRSRGPDERPETRGAIRHQDCPPTPATRRSLGADASQNHGVRHPQIRAAIRRGLCPRSRLFGACDTERVLPALSPK